VNHDLANLLGAIRERPDDKVAYLALADWCLDHPDLATQARGEHVRQSIALAERPPAGLDAREARALVKAIEKRWRVAWLGPLREIGHRCDFLPGGLVKLEVTHGRTAQARGVRLAPLTQEQFAWVSSLALRALRLDDLRWLAGQLPAGHLRSLHIEGMTAEGLSDVLARCPWLGGVRVLILHSWDVPFPAAEVVRLADLGCLGDVGELCLRNAQLDVPACSALSRSPHLRHLRKLTLQQCSLGTASVRALLSHTFAPPLGVLSLENNAITLAAAEILAGWPALGGVRKLVLDRNPLGNDGLAALLQSLYLGELRELSLQECRLTSRGLEALAGVPLGKLESLDVSNNEGIGDAGLVALGESPSLSALRKLRHSHSVRDPRARDALNRRFGLLS
jgi:uncharacterized protein (TIGR02996 family)